jgi:hypothetical protein
VLALKPVIEPVTVCVVSPANTVAKLAVLRTVADGAQGALIAAQLSMVARFVPINSLGVDARNFALTVAEMLAVDAVMFVTDPVTASGIAVTTAMPSLVLPPDPRVCPNGAFAAPRTFEVDEHAPVTEAQDDPPPPPDPFPPPPP